MLRSTGRRRIPRRPARLEEFFSTSDRSGQGLGVARLYAGREARRPEPATSAAIGGVAETLMYPADRRSGSFLVAE
jgi:hypothetical protein